MGSLPRDPTQPPNVATPSTAQTESSGNESSIQVQAILISDGRQAAVVNGKIVQIGDRVLGYKIEAITKDYVEFANFDSTFKVMLFNTKLEAGT